MKKTYAVECPNCGKDSLIQRSENLYQRLSCDFRKDFSFLSFGKILLSFLAVIIVAFLMRNSFEFARSEPINNTPNFQSSPDAN
jgi:hypothetical protein